jgi:FkbM family methyltransferase
MNPSIKNIAKDIIPPIIWRGLRGLNQSFAPLKFKGKTSLQLPSGKLLSLRDLPEDRDVCNQIFFRGDYDLGRLRRYSELLAFYAQASRPLIVDAGANIGAGAAWFATHFPRASIIAVEPDVGNFRVLERNAQTWPTIRPLQAAIAQRHGTLILTDPGEGAWGFRTSTDSTAAGYSVNALTIEEIMALEPNAAPFILKIDIEGAEADLFSRHSIAFQKFPVVIIELHDWMLPRVASSQNFLSWHSANKRDFIYVGENVFSISNPIDRSQV